MNKEVKKEVILKKIKTRRRKSRNTAVLLSIFMFKHPMIIDSQNYSIKVIPTTS